uniref:Putative secreted protein n=1 Tax=Panstrongylus lignarius TaxID=156445 RepID=A0A224Y0Z1_9HEMI
MAAPLSLAFLIMNCISSTVKATSFTPSPCFATCKFTSFSFGSYAEINTNFILFCCTTWAAYCLDPVSKPL